MKSAKLTPFHDNLLLSEIPGVTQVGSIIVPEKHISPLNQGRVEDKGPLVSDKINIGDIVFFAPHSESRLTWRGTKVLIVTESNCLGSITELPE